MKLVTTAQMRALEAAAVAAGVTERQLMEEAGLAVAQEAWMALGTLEGRKIVCLVGPGNNGGDAIVAGRHLYDWGAEVFLAVPRRRRDNTLIEELEPREIAVLAGEDDPALTPIAEALAGADLVIDGLLGIGQERPIDPDEPIGKALAALRQARKGYTPPKLIAVDLPTGMNADTGAIDALLVEPDQTITFGLPKVGMYQAPGSAHAGKVQVVDIGIPKAAQEAVPLDLLTARWARTALPARPEDGNKGTFGRIVVVGGSPRYLGAPRLAAEGAYRAGGGLVTIACPAPLIPSLAPGIAEATWLPQHAAGDGGLPGAAALALRGEWRNFDAAVVGPGMGDTEETRALLWATLPDIALDVARGAVFDADALNILARLDGDDARGRLGENSVLTPHPGEAARLLGCSVAEVQSRRMDAARDLAAKFGCVAVLKGAHTVIAEPGGRAALSPWANPLMATAGAGDVLAGAIAAFLGQGAAPFEAACLGVYLHGAAGESLREQYGESGLLAGEIADRLPLVVKEVRAP